MARTYKRDSRGRFASGGGSSGGSRPKPKPMQRGANRLTRDNAGRITSVGGTGATARGGRLRTAAGKKRATVTAKISGGKPGSTVGKPKGLKPGSIKPKAKAKGRSAVLNAQKASLNKQRRSLSASQAAARGDRASVNRPMAGSRVTRDRQPPPRPLTPPGRGLDAQKGMNKTALKLNQEFFGSSGYLSQNMERNFRNAGTKGRTPIDNTRYLGALASRLSEKELRSRTAVAIKRLNKQQRRHYIQDIQDARRNIVMTRFGVPKVGASDRQLLNAIRFDTAARNLAGQRAMRKRRGSRNSSEEYAWVTNAMLSTSRKRK